MKLTEQVEVHELSNSIKNCVEVWHRRLIPQEGENVSFCKKRTRFIPSSFCPKLPSNTKFFLLP